ncbi:MAG: V-type ATP synthase subunit I, partial [Clostridia bacterium]|nr:V-type ATP synthase subunit I [Clostridia bacterium]
VSGTARENLTALRAELKQKQADKLTAEGELAAYGQKRALIEQSCDAVINEMSRQDTRNLMLMTDNVVFFSGWLPAELVKPVETLCSRLGAACEFEDPTDEDDVPVSLHSGKLTDNFNSVTSMYGMPAYNSFIDPTPTMAFFYIMAFGVMLSDAAYGLLLALGCAIYLKRVKPQGGMKSTMTMFLLCGISTFLWGMLLGGFFGNSLEVISGNFFGHKIVQPAWINPIDQPIQMMVLSYVFGAVQIFAAMFLDSLRRIKRKDWLGAIFGIYAWYLLFIGLGLLLLMPSIGIYVAIAGAVGVMIGGSLGKKGFGKITGGLMALYDITGFLSDILSYSRLLALCLSTAVVSNVINTMGSLFGGGIGGAIAFSLVFIIGHVFNLALNLLGSYVHTSRLQYIEYFGRFYEGGGRTFEPLQIKTKYVNIIQEVN